MSRPAKGQVEVVYSAESSLSHPGAMFAGMWRDLLDSRELAWRLLVRDLNARYRQSLLGFAWALVPPVFVAVALTLAADAKLINTGRTGVAYPAYVMLGMVLWQTFTDALNAPIRALTDAKALMARVSFPREAVVLARLGELWIDFSIKLVLLVGVFLWFKVPTGWTTFTLAPLVLLDLVLLGIFFGLLLVPLAMLYEDVTKGLSLAVVIWFAATPVAYEAPEAGMFADIIRLNPVTPLLVAARDLAMGGPGWFSESFWTVTGIAVIGNLVAWIAFRLAMPFVIERMSA